jgi:hypothetical protein
MTIRQCQTSARFGIRLVDGVLLALLVAAVALLVSRYVSAERAYYWADYDNYQRLTQAKIAELKTSPLRGAYTIWRTMGDDYGQLPTLPLIIPTLAFGASRRVYVMSLALLYLVPLAITYGALAASIVRRRHRTAFWLAAWLTVGTPALTISVLRGYPDAGGAALVGLATVTFIRGCGLQSRSAAFAVGVLLAMAVLFRRPFIFDALAFGCVAALVTAASALGGDRAPWRGIGHLLALAAGIVITLALIGTPFLVRLLRENFGALYASYAVPILDGIAFYATAFGVCAWVAAATGFIAATSTGIAAVGTAVLVGALSLSTLAIWIAIPAQLGEHYPLHFGSFVVLGLTLLGVTMLDRLRAAARAFVLLLAIAFVVVNLALGLGLAQPAPTSPWIFARASPPLRHADYDGMATLVGELRRIAGGNRRIYVAASSDVIGCSLLAAADRSVAGDSGRLQVLPCIHVDSRDEYPLEKLLWADIVLIARPVQYHLPPDQQHLVTSVVDAFVEQWPIATDFRLRPDRLPLVDGQVEVEVYERIHPTSVRTAIQTFRRFSGVMPKAPGGQKPWIAFTPDPTRHLELDRMSGDTNVSFRLPTRSTEMSEALLSIDALPDQASLVGRLHADCARPQIEARSFDENGLDVGAAPLSSDHDGTFRLDLLPRTRHVLLIGQGDDASVGCTVEIDGLGFE